MGLSSTNIAKVKRLSLREPRLPATAPETAPGPRPTEEDIDYSKLVARYPLIEDLVESFDLVSAKTGEPLRKVDISEEIAPEVRTQEAGDGPRLIALAQKIIMGRRSYTKAEILERIVAETRVSRERAERGFNMMLQAGAIEATLETGCFALH